MAHNPEDVMHGRKSLTEMVHNKYEGETKRGKGRQIRRHAVILWEKERFVRARLKGVGKIHSSCFPVLDSEPAYKP